MRGTTDRFAATLLALVLTLTHAAPAYARAADNDGLGGAPGGGFTYQTRPQDGVGAVNLAARATAGDGSSGSPYTGWTSAISFSANDLNLYFPAKQFNFSSPLVFTGNRVKIRCEPGAVLKFTGSGVAITSDGGARSGEIFGFRMEGGCRIVGNASATIGLLLRASHHVYADVDVKDVTFAGVKTEWSVVSDLRVTVSKHTGAFAVQPQHGIVFDKRGSGEGAHAGNLWPKIEWVSGDGIVCNWCDSMVMHAGTSEGNGGRGRYFSPNTNQNTVIGGDDEANGGDDLTDEGTSNQFINYMTNKAGGKGVARFKGKRAVINGGRYDTVIIEAEAAETHVTGGPSYNDSGTGTFTDNSTTTRYHSRVYNYRTSGYYVPNFDLPPARSWANAGGSWANIGYYKRGDMVFLRGCAAGGSGTMTTLPAGARPATDRSYSVRTGTTPTPGTVSVSSGGGVVFAGGTNTLVCLDGISFELP